ncbi:PREDICTED: protein JASON-like isoform X1 [Lupinus angustifolius]|uniref:protein JASON-like isoform X1 n=1 Tax=Lupinus angustifolius TaxID=3871 RepID=UPI00092F4D62|nr:PREDICTED: protein JASON-like isoform X1 [Lupinus angustifolius]
MGCFLACFGSSKSTRIKQHSSPKRNSCGRPQQQCVSSVQDHSNTTHVTPSLQNHDKSEEQLSVSTGSSSQLQDKSEEQLSVSTRKKVTFDSNVKTYEPILQDEEPEKKNIAEGKVEGLSEKPTQSKSSSFSEDSSVTSTGSYPPNHRYQNCRDSDDEVEDDELDYEASDLSDDEEGDNEEFEDGMVYSSPIQMCDNSDDVNSMGLNSNPNARDRSVYVHPVLNPVENLTQWKVVKSKRTKPLSPQKENYISSNHESKNAYGTEEEPSTKEVAFNFNSDTDISRKLKQEISVDSSLSNWLVSPETTPVNKPGLVPCYAGTPDRTTSQGSAVSREDRPILGALTLDEIRQFSANSSPRKSPSQSPVDMPIIGTVGTYWNFTDSAEDSNSVSRFKGIPNTTSKYREDKRVNWHSTPFEKRLEKALSEGAAEAASTYVPHVF